jgi:hypothetical protein
MPNNPFDDSFVPLTTRAPSAGSRVDFRVAIVSQAENTQPFRPLGPAVAGAAPAAHGAGCEPRIAVQREGDRVSSIQIQCGCGQLIELACIYEPPPQG